jgi:linoleate 8R-lipoxygenase / 9,12-octadecadienoate 8-hydroperoxide 8R-isomerase
MAESNSTPIRKVVGKSLSQLRKVIGASLRPLPSSTGDGTYVAESSTTGIVNDLPHINVDEVDDLIKATKSAATGDPTNDKEYIMERVIQACVETFRLKSVD